MPDRRLDLHGFLALRKMFFSAKHFIQKRVLELYSNIPVSNFYVVDDINLFNPKSL